MPEPAAPDPDGAPDASPRSTAALLVDPTFGPWFLGNLLSNSGNWLYNVTAAVVVYNLTGSALLVGVVSVAQFASLAILSPWAGALSDRFDRRLMLVASQAFAAASATGIAVTVVLTGADGLPGAWPVILATTGIGVGVAFAGPALQALVPALVDDADLENAVALTSLTFNIGRAIGPAAGGVLLATVGAEVAFVVNAVSFLALIGALALIRPRAVARTDGGDRSVRAGLAYVRADPVLLALLVGIGAVGFAADPINTLAPPLAAALGGGDGLVAFLVSAFGVGAAGIALVAGRVQRQFGVLPVARAGCLVLAAGLVAAALAPGPATALIAFAVMGTGFLLGVSTLTSALQRRVDEDLRGRVMALWSVAFLGTRPVAAIVDGAAADLLGVRPAFVVPVAVAVFGAFVATRLLRQAGAHATAP